MAYDLSGGAAIIEGDAITLPTKMTLSLWTRRTGNGGGGFGRLFEHCSADASLVGSMRLQNDGGTAIGTYAFVYPWTTRPNWTFARPADNTWAHIMVAYDAGLAANVPTVWVNGAAVAVTTVSAAAGSPIAQTDNIAIGNRVFAKDRQFSGGVAEVAYWETLQATAVAQRLANGERAYDVAPTALRVYIPLASDTRNWITDVNAITAGADITTGGAPIIAPVAGSTGLLRLSGNAVNVFSDWRALPVTGVLTLRGQPVTARLIAKKRTSTGTLTLRGNGVNAYPFTGNTPVIAVLQLRGGAVTATKRRYCFPSSGVLSLLGGGPIESHYSPQPAYHGKWRGVGGAVKSTAVIRRLQNTESPRVQSWLVRMRDSAVKARVADPRTKFVKIARIYANPLRTMATSSGLLRFLGGSIRSGKVFLARCSTGQLRLLGGVPAAIRVSKTVSTGVLRLLGGAVDQRGQPVTRSNATVRIQSWLARAGGSAVMARVADPRTKFVKVARIFAPRIYRTDAPSAGNMTLIGGEVVSRREVYVGEPSPGRLHLLGGEPIFAVGNVRRVIASTGTLSLFGGAPSHGISYGWAYVDDASSSWSAIPAHMELRHVLT